MKSAKEIRKAIESKVVTYGWWRVCEEVEELLIQWEKDVREDQRKIHHREWRESILSLTKRGKRWKR